MADASPFLTAFVCDLVAEKILTLLPLEDVKALSLVSRGVLATTRGTKEFCNRVKLNLTEEAFQSDLLAGGVYRAKHVFLELFRTLPFEKDNQLGSIIRSAESLHLSFPETPKLSEGNEEMTTFVKGILTNSKSLGSLKMEAGILHTVDPAIFSTGAIQYVLCGLHSLEIAADVSKGHGSIQPSFPQSLQSLMEMPLTLKRLSIGLVSMFQGRQLNYLDIIPRLIAKVKDTLRELEVLELQAWMMSEMKDIRSPGLRSLKLRAIGGDQISSAGVVDAFLRNQPRLEELDISMCMSFPRSTLAVIVDMGSKLRKLHIKTQRFSGAGEQQPINWEFLGRMAKLKDFSLVKPHTSRSSRIMFGWGVTRSCKQLGEDILRALPPNLERISLEGFKYFWGRDRLPQEKNVGLLLARFKNLTRLSLKWSPGALTDEGLQTVIDSCPKLTYLDISHADSLTNYGVTGIRPGELEKTGASLDELKGLTHLRILNCPNISPRMLLPHLKFKYLRSLHYLGSRRVGLKFLLQVAQQNPCLENVSIDLVGFRNPTPPDSLAGLKAVVRFVNPRVRHFDLQMRCSREDDDIVENVAEALTPSGIDLLRLADFRPIIVIHF